MDQDLTAVIGRIEAALVEGGVDKSSAKPSEYRPLEEISTYQVTGWEVDCAGAHMVWGAEGRDPTVILMVGDGGGTEDYTVSRLDEKAWYVGGFNGKELSAINAVELFGGELYASAQEFKARTATETEAMEIVAAMARRFEKIRRRSSP